jgi:hypothetical protein
MWLNIQYSSAWNLMAFRHADIVHYCHVTHPFALVSNKLINMPDKHDLNFDTKPTATCFGFLSGHHKAVYEYEKV